MPPEWRRLADSYVPGIVRQRFHGPAALGALHPFGCPEEGGGRGPRFSRVPHPGGGILARTCALRRPQKGEIEARYRKMALEDGSSCLCFSPGGHSDLAQGHGTPALAGGARMPCPRERILGRRGVRAGLCEPRRTSVRGLT